MIKKHLKNYLVFLKYKLKNKEKTIKKSIIQNNNFNINKIFYFNLKTNKILNEKISQMSAINKGVKKRIYINRWETTKLYNDNKLVNFKKWHK